MQAHLPDRIPWIFASLAFFWGGCNHLFAQHTTLSVSSATAIAGETVNLAISLDVPGRQPSGLRWTLRYSQAQISAIYIGAGPAAIAAGKTASCSAASGQYTCVVAGPNALGIASGVVATAQITLAPAAATSSVALLNLVAVDSSGSSLEISATRPAMVVVPVLSTFSCVPASLFPSSNTSCAVALSSSAPAEGIPVKLTTSTPSVAVPPSVTIPAGSISTSFNASVVNTLTISQSATIMATFGGVARIATVNLAAGAASVGLVVAPSSLLFEVSAGHTTSQTVSLTGVRSDGSFAVTPVTANGGKWLSVTPASGSASNRMTLSVTVDPTGLTAGAYIGSVTVSITGGVSASIAVMMNVSVAGQLVASPSALSFTFDPNNPESTPARGITVFSNPAGADFAAIADQGSAGWLLVGSAGSMETPGSFSVSVSAANLVPGLYSGQISITSSVSNPVQVPVTLNVTGAPPKLFVPGVTQRFAVLQGDGPRNGEIVVTNGGGGTLHFAAQVTPGTGNWLTLNSRTTGSATIEEPASLGFTLNPAALDAGIYTGQITIQDTDSQAQSIVTIIMAVNTAAKLITVSQRGLTFVSVEGGALTPNQSFTATSRGAGAEELSIQTELLPNAQGLQCDWLSVAYSGASTVTVSVDQSGLRAGQYYGSIAISDTSAVNSPATVSVMLTVLPATSTGPVIQLSTGGVVFTGQAGSQSMQQQQVNIFNPLSNIVTWSAAIYSSSAGWVTTPSSGTLLPGTNTVQLQADFSALSPAVQDAILSLAFNDGTLARVRIEAIASPQLTTTATKPQALRSTPHGRSFYPTVQASACSGGSPDLLLSVFQSPSDGTTLQAGIAQSVRVQALDNCGNSLAERNGDAVQVIFSDGEVPLTLHDTGGGFWEATWVPQTPTARLALQAVPFEHGPGALILAGLSISTVVQPSPTEITQISGVVNAALASQAPVNVVAPGSFVAMYGTGLSAGGLSPPTAPLPTTLNGTQLLLGSKPMPLLYASPTQLNAFIPQDLNLNTEHDLTVVQGFTRSVPVPLILTGLQPGIYSADSSGSGQGVVEIAGTALLAAPVSNFSRPVQRGVEFVIAYCTGLGPVVGVNGEIPPADGEAAPVNVVYQVTGMTTATIGGVDAPVEFSGLTPTLVGVYQVNIEVPAGVPAGDAVPLIISVKDPQSGATVQSNSVTIAVK
jgi:uncharacterized protein (TIGR03437 family)